MLLIKNTNLYSPTFLGKKDILISNGKVVAIEDEITKHNVFSEVWDAQGLTTTPGFIDQHIHVIGAGGKHGFASMTPQLHLGELIKCGTTSVVGLLGTDGSTRSIKTLYSKIQALNQIFCVTSVMEINQNYSQGHQDLSLMKYVRFFNFDFFMR